MLQYPANFIKASDVRPEPVDRIYGGTTTTARGAVNYIRAARRFADDRGRSSRRLIILGRGSRCPAARVSTLCKPRMAKPGAAIRRYDVTESVRYAASATHLRETGESDVGERRCDIAHLLPRPCGMFAASTNVRTRPGL